MSGTVMQPTKPIIEAAEFLESAVGRFLQARTTFPKLGKYESDLEALNLFYLVVRHVEAICTLANRDLVLLPSALAIGRAAFESTSKILWMLHPEHAFERETRWLAHLADEEKYLFELLPCSNHSMATANSGKKPRREHRGFESESRISSRPE